MSVVTKLNSADGIARQPLELTLSEFGFQPASPQQLFVLQVSETPVSPFDVAKDGRFLVRADVPQASHSLTAIVSW
jgi:hypothetical protein